MITPQVAILIGLFLTLLGVFSGYWFSTINKKTERAGIDIQANRIKINENTNNNSHNKELNDKSHTRLREEMTLLASDMRVTLKGLSRIGLEVASNKSEIQNLKSQHEIISGRLRRRGDGN